MEKTINEIFQTHPLKIQLGVVLSIIVIVITFSYKIAKVESDYNYRIEKLEYQQEITQENIAKIETNFAKIDDKIDNVLITLNTISTVLGISEIEMPKKSEAKIPNDENNFFSFLQPDGTETQD